MSDSDRAMISDGFASIDHDAEAVDLVELTLSGDMTYTAPLPTDLDPAAVQRAVRVTANRSIMVASTRVGACIASTIPAFDPLAPDSVVTHTLTACSVKGHTISGTVVSTWNLEDICLRATHRSTDLMIDGRASTISLSVNGCLGESFQLRRRTLDFSSTSGETAEPFTITGVWTAEYDLAAGCGTRDGTVTTTFAGDHALQRTERDVHWCNGLTTLSQPETLDTIDSGVLELGRLGQRVVVRFDGTALDVLSSRGEQIATTQALD